MVFPCWTQYKVPILLKDTHLQNKTMFPVHHIKTLFLIPIYINFLLSHYSFFMHIHSYISFVTQIFILNFHINFHGFLDCELIYHFGVISADFKVCEIFLFVLEPLRNEYMYINKCQKKRGKVFVCCSELNTNKEKCKMVFLCDIFYSQ